MNFTKHYGLNGTHAVLSASHYHWLNYDNEKLIKYYLVSSAKEMGTKKHSLAAQLIELGVHINCPENLTLQHYVNDSIDANMQPEIPLIYDNLCYGTADAIRFDEENNALTIYDLKTGTTPASMKQLMIYAALFYLEYSEYDPEDCTTYLRIYQNDEYEEYFPTAEEINDVMCKIVKAVEIISTRKEND